MAEDWEDASCTNFNFLVRVPLGRKGLMKKQVNKWFHNVSYMYGDRSREDSVL
jgi:hypothetical protein